MLQSVKQLLKTQSNVAMYLHDDTETIKRLKDRGTDCAYLLIQTQPAHVHLMRSISQESEP